MYCLPLIGIAKISQAIYKLFATSFRGISWSCDKKREMMEIYPMKNENTLKTWFGVEISHSFRFFFSWTKDFRRNSKKRIFNTYPQMFILVSQIICGFMVSFIFVALRFNSTLLFPLFFLFQLQKSLTKFFLNYYSLKGKKIFNFKNQNKIEKKRKTTKKVKFWRLCDNLSEK